VLPTFPSFILPEPPATPEANVFPDASNSPIAHERESSPQGRDSVQCVAALQAIAGDLMLGSGNADAALEFYFKVDNMLPSVDSATRIAHVYLRAGEFPSARRMLEVAIERDAQDGISEEKMAQYVTIFEFIDERINSNLP